MWDALETLGVVRTLTALVGATVLVVGARAYLATRRKSLLLFASGMGTASLGYLVQGALVQFSHWSITRATMLESVFSLAAFSLLAAGVWVRDAPRRRVTREPGSGSRPTAR